MNTFLYWSGVLAWLVLGLIGMFWLADIVIEEAAHTAFLEGETVVEFALDVKAMRE
jgi:hypothetical protein